MSALVVYLRCVFDCLSLVLGRQSSGFTAQTETRKLIIAVGPPHPFLLDQQRTRSDVVLMLDSIDPAWPAVIQ